MANNIEQYGIVFKGLKTGVHHFNFILDNRFFGHFGNPELRGGDMEINVELDKKDQFLSLDFTFSGSVRVICDRCLEEFDAPLTFRSSLVIKFVQEERENEADVIYLERHEKNINLADYFIESMCLNLPIKRVHEKNDIGVDMCDKDMIDKLEEHRTRRTEGETDPRWESLKNINKKN